MCTEHSTDTGEVDSLIQYFVMDDVPHFFISRILLVCHVGSMLFPRIPAAHSWGCSALILSLICFVLANMTQALGWTVAFCVSEKITKLSSDSHHKERFIGGKKDLELFFSCEAL